MGLQGFILSAYSEVPAQHLILLPSHSCLLSPTPPSHFSKYSFLMKILLLMIRFLTVCEKLTDFLCTSKSKSRKQRQGLCVGALLYRSCNEETTGLTNTVG